MDAALVVNAHPQSCQPLGKKIAVFPVLQIRGIVVALIDEQRLRPFPGRHMGQLDLLMDIRVQILVGVHGEIPLPPTPLHHRVAGGREVIHPREVKHLVGVALRYLPGPVMGAGIGHDDLAGQRVPQGLERLEAPFYAADLVFYDQSNGQKRFCHMHSSFPGFNHRHG